MFHRVKEPANLASTTKSGLEGVHVHYDVISNFCHCTYTARECLTEKGSSALCKHVLAVKLAEAM